MARLAEPRKIELSKGKISWLKVDQLNWAEYPYQPNVQVEIAWKEAGISLVFNVQEHNIRAEETQINGKVHQDSCVEFFISPRSDGNYYNFEFNCIGTPHVAYGRGRGNREKLPVEVIRQLTIHSSLGNQPFTEKSGEFSWQLSVEIPISCLIHDELSSFDGLNAKANFYKCGDDLAQPHFITWNPVLTVQPDYHQYPFFGELNFR